MAKILAILRRYLPRVTVLDAQTKYPTPASAARVGLKASNFGSSEGQQFRAATEDEGCGSDKRIPATRAAARHGDLPFQRISVDIIDRCRSRFRNGYNTA